MYHTRVLIASAALAATPVVAWGQTLNDASIPINAHASGFAEPTGIEFLGRSPTDFFVIEKATGRVMRSLNGAAPVSVLDLGVASESERGLLGIAKDPNFASNNYVYLYYSKSSTGGDVTSGSWLENRLSRFTWNGSTLGSETVLKTFGTSGDGETNNGPNHDAGPIHFGPDGKLYGTTGDLNRNRAEQNYVSEIGTSAKVGGLYRLNTDGSIPSDNPLVGANAAFHQWYAYGVRNTFGLGFDPLTGALWDTENGPGSYDEINRVAPGFNSGWERIMGPASRDAEGTSDLVNLSGGQYSDPEFSFQTPVAVTDINFLANTTIDANYRDAALVGSHLNGGELYLFRLNANRDAFTSLPAGLTDLVADTGGDAGLAQRSQVRFGQTFGSVTGIETGPDGGIYLVRYGSGVITRLGFKSWKTDADGSWTAASNWQGGVPSTTQDYANFFDTISAPRTITATGSVMPAGVIFSSQHRYTINPTSLFMLQNFGGTAGLRVLKGSHTIAGQVMINSHATLDILDASSVMTISGPLVVNDNNFTTTKTGPGTIEAAAFKRVATYVTTANLNVTGGTFRVIPNGTNAGTSVFNQLTISGGGKFDLTDNRMALTGMTVGAWNNTNYTGVTNLIKAGRGNSGTWNGSGIVTSMSDALPAQALTTVGIATASQVLGIAAGATGTWSGEQVSGDDPLIAYTYAGDANLSGYVDADDYFQIDAHNGTTDNNEKSFYNGDFDYDGSIDGDDYFLIDQSYLGQSGSLYPAVGVGSVPEPSGGMLLALGWMLRRRRGGAG